MIAQHRRYPETTDWGARILESARKAGIEIPERGVDKKQILCPFHEDKNPSACLFIKNGAFHCFVCFPNGGLNTLEFEAKLAGQPLTHRRSHSIHKSESKAEASFTPQMARAAWRLAQARARDDDAVEADRPVYEYLQKRGLQESWNEGAFGILSPEMALPESIAFWPRNSYRLLAALYNEHGAVSGLQARAIEPAEKKVLFPKGQASTGLVFANRLGVSLLQAQWSGPPVVILGEGLTDFLALSIFTNVPVLSAPGTGFVFNSFGSWTRGKHVLLAIDRDRAGASAVSAAQTPASSAGAKRLGWLKLPAGSKDICDVVAQHGIDELRRRIDATLEAFLS